MAPGIFGQMRKILTVTIPALVAPGAVDFPSRLFKRAPPPPPTVTLTANPASPVTGQPYTVTAVGSDSSGFLASVSIIKNGAAFASTGAGNGATSTAQGSTWDFAGTVNYSAQATDVYGFVSSPNTLAVTVNKATPVISHWPNRPIANNTGYTVTAADLGAVFSSPYGSAVVQPSGTVTYTIVSDSSSGTFAAGSMIASGTLLPPAIYTIRASYPGDANYIATLADAIWVISNPVTLTTASAATVYFGQTVTSTADSADKDGLLVSQDIDYLPPPGSAWVTGAATWSGGPIWRKRSDLDDTHVDS